MNTKEIDQAIELAKQNNQKAFAILFDAHWEYVYGYLLKRLQDEILAEELALKTLAKAFDKIDTFKKEYNFKTWLISISKNLQIDHHRSSNIKGQLDVTSIDKKHLKDLSDDNPSPEKAPINGPTMIPRGPIKIKPMIRPMVEPMTPFFDPPNFLVPKAGII